MENRTLNVEMVDGMALQDVKGAIVTSTCENQTEMNFLLFVAACNSPALAEAVTFVGQALQDPAAPKAAGVEYHVVNSKSTGQ